jgi:hypothetical protein
VVFGGPQTPLQNVANVVNYSSPPCAGISGLSAEAAGGTCPPGVDWDATAQLCVAMPPMDPPPETAPDLGTATKLGNCPAPLTTSLPAGVYEVPSSNGGCTDLTIQASQNCVSFYLDPGATVFMGGSGNSTNLTITAFGDTAPHPGGPACAAPPPGTPTTPYPFYSPNVPSTPATNVTFDGPGCCPTFTLYGTTYLPTGTAFARKNLFLNVVGQMLVNTWNEQSGSHPSLQVNYSPGDDTPIPEVMRLSE